MHIRRWSQSSARAGAGARQGPCGFWREGSKWTPAWKCMAWAGNRVSWASVCTSPPNSHSKGTTNALYRRMSDLQGCSGPQFFKCCPWTCVLGMSYDTPPWKSNYLSKTFSINQRYLQRGDASELVHRGEATCPRSYYKWWVSWEIHNAQRLPKLAWAGEKNICLFNWWLPKSPGQGIREPDRDSELPTTASVSDQ